MLQNENTTHFLPSIELELSSGWSYSFDFYKSHTRINAQLLFSYITLPHVKWNVIESSGVCSAIVVK